MNTHRDRLIASVVTMLLLSAFLNACTEKPMLPTAYISTPTTVQITASKATTSTPLIAATASRTPTIPIPSPTRFPVSTISSPELPELVLILGPIIFPLYDCGPFALPGQVWRAEYPESTPAPLLTDPNIGLYEPVWSPDGQWIAYIAVEIKDPIESYVANGLEKRYEKSDSIWITHPDGSENKIIGDRYDRIDFEVQYCEPSAGIFDIQGWSPDSQWIAYHYTSYFGPDIPSANVLVNITTGEQVRLRGKTRIHWAPTSNKLVYDSEDGKYLEILDVDKLDESPILILMPPSTPDTPGYSMAFWSQDEKALFLLGWKGENQSYFAPQSLWRVDLSTNEWEQIGIIESGSTIKKSPRSNRVAICVDELERLEIRNLDNWTDMKSISISNEIFCDTLDWFYDSLGNEYVSFLSRNGEEVWVYNLSNTPLKPYKIIELAKLDAPTGYKLVNLSWGSIVTP